MDNRRLNMSALEKEITLVETDAVVEEQYNADKNYASLDNELKSIIAQIPYPETELYTTAIDYEDRDRLVYEKERNEPYWIKRDIVKKYCNNGSLYSGHLNLNGSHYYIMDNRSVTTKIINVNGEDIWLINADDRLYADYVKWWRYPSENRNIQFSRNITMQNRKVSEVDIILDKGNDLFSNISDAYLRKALIRNKDKNGTQSIIQTIQKKQDYIRSLPKGKSFIVQGCAGSGKTMVLLHRLRYLLYNNEIHNDEYVFLVPGNNFKEFIDGITVDFNIKKNNILSYQEYYQEILGKKLENTSADKSELVFSAEYLEKVYSKIFMCEVCEYVFDMFFEQIELLITFSEGKLNGLLDLEKTVLVNELNETKSKAVVTASEIAKKVENYTNTKTKNEFDNIQLLVEELEDIYFRRKSEYENLLSSNTDITISPEDTRLISNEKLLEIKKNIDTESLAVEKASVFTAISHKNKLKKLQEYYQEVYEEVINGLKEDEKKKHAQQVAQSGFVYENITFTEIENILEQLKSLLNTTNEHIVKLQSDLDNVVEYLGVKYAKEIENLNKLIEVSSDVLKYKKEYVENLVSVYSFFEENVFYGVELLDSIRKYITQEENELIKNKMQLFSKRTPNQLYAYLNTLMFNTCKKKISKEFDINLCEVYKHYWYLNLYCAYLTRPINANNIKYIFIDEAQDLSVSEIELINKVNAIFDAPVINLFGDVNQMITTHGVRDWSQLTNISEVYILEENFRNTNQIVEYCNKNLITQMVKIGVDMDEVDEYKTIHDAIKTSKTIFKNTIFIVKNDYCVLDLEKLLSQLPIKEYEIYTVKSAKGLEFKEVFVFDEAMSLNEKYISYTRALTKLNIIKTLPEMVDRKTELIVQGSDK